MSIKYKQKLPIYAHWKIRINNSYPCYRKRKNSVLSALSKFIQKFWKIIFFSIFLSNLRVLYQNFLKITKMCYPSYSDIEKSFIHFIQKIKINYPRYPNCVNCPFLLYPNDKNALYSLFQGPNNVIRIICKTIKDSSASSKSSKCFIRIIRLYLSFKNTCIIKKFK